MSVETTGEQLLLSRATALVDTVAARMLLASWLLVCFDSCDLSRWHRLEMLDSRLISDYLDENGSHKLNLGAARVPCGRCGCVCGR